MLTIDQTYQQHLETLQQRAEAVMDQQQLDALIIHSGYPLPVFLDDNHYPFKANPHFKHWLPLCEHPHCWLIIVSGAKPVLVYHQSDDYWHSDKPLAGDWLSHFDVKIMRQPQDVEPFLPAGRNRCAYLGDHPELAEALAIGERNPEAVLNYLHYYRSYKTDYEVECISMANGRALRAHTAAKEAFYAGASEFEIHLAYLSSLGEGENQLPYPNIVALNEHAAVLHYDRQLPHALPEAKLHSFLLDAGAQYRGYAADITRTYAYRKGVFAELVAEMDSLQQSLANAIAPGKRFLDLHNKTHRLVAKLLVDFQLIRCGASAAVEQGLTRYFFPHGLGHFLGLQVHDVAGFMQDPQGTHLAAPDNAPFLRCTRVLESSQVLTIEPGLYFIDSLLAKLAESEFAGEVNWEQVDELRRYGGIRIEDNVLVTDNGARNLTRELEH
ncbi:Xaa-Pro dipeptidase [Aliagarivorans taiwanensis]|uniref:Xaa-Pro dipeptidase n=1 Tax=Aliagarivorans taiwanensis TaxID=561966 RepID=UPI000424964A|nr:Xaa-Pro dipeptidase [Aliagarivorans taiwanensis]